YQCPSSFPAVRSTERGTKEEKHRSKKGFCKWSLMPDQRLEQLKGKYQSVLNLNNQLGVQLQNLHVQDNKLFLKGQAKTKADSNKVWDQIKLVDSNYQQDLMAQF